MVNATRSECLNCIVEAFDVAQLQYADHSPHGFPNEVDVIIVADVMYYISWGGWPPIGNWLYPSFMVSGYQTRLLQHLTRRARKEVIFTNHQNNEGVHRFFREMGISPVRFNSSFSEKPISFWVVKGSATSWRETDAKSSVGMLSRSGADSATEKAVTSTDSLVPANPAKSSFLSFGEFVNEKWQLEKEQAIPVMTYRDEDRDERLLSLLENFSRRESRSSRQKKEYMFPCCRSSHIKHRQSLQELSAWLLCVVFRAIGYSSVSARGLMEFANHDLLCLCALLRGLFAARTNDNSLPHDTAVIQGIALDALSGLTAPELAFPYSDGSE
ncbi:unnamed protein product, partial [Polarella glacialis]